ncbi:hypothetical protein LCGC14_1893650 [marine sediment metagenome]|uniref:Uncharacterized protein n=1 Tax=marine sediment metagenome TaxID=412755 RepID=A0A0F9ICJ5_9ZZZZ
MKKALAQWKPADVIALVVIVIAGGLLWQGIDGKVGVTLIVVVTAYYGIDLTPVFSIGRIKKHKEDTD